MWGHTFQDLKNAGQQMIQPFAALRALGIHKQKLQNWGISWWMHFGRQLANREDFYADGELDDFIAYLRKNRVPEEWIPTQEEWDGFLRQAFVWLCDLAKFCYGGALLVYLGLHLFIYLSTRRSPSKPKLLGRLVALHFVVGALAFATIYCFDNSLMGKYVNSGYAQRKPFPAEVDVPQLSQTTLPDRADVLIGSRFDASYLASFNHVLDYHPGNRRLLREILPWFGSKHVDMVMALVGTPVDGVASRFLKQEYHTGYWTVMNPSDRRQTIKELLLEQENPLIRRLSTVLKGQLADARFGLARDTVLAKKHVPYVVSRWQEILLGKSDTSRKQVSGKSLLVPTRYVKHVKSSTGLQVKRPSTMIFDASAETRILSIGERVSQYGQPAKILHIYNDNLCHVEYNDGSSATVSVEELDAYRHWTQGDSVEVRSDEDDYYGEASMIPAEVALVHPLGTTLDVRYEDGNGGFHVPIEQISMIKSSRKLQLSQSQIFEVSLGDKVWCNFEGQGNWFPARITARKGDLYDVKYDDGDFEAGVSVDRLRSP